MKLYRAESPQHRLKSLEARMFRDFLLRYAEENGLLLAASSNVAKDLCRVIGAETSDARRVANWMRELVAVGYLSCSPEGRLQIVKFSEAQAARSPGAKRQADYRARQRGNDDNASPGDESSDVTGALRVTSQREEKRREREGEEIPPPPKGSDDFGEEVLCPQTVLPPLVAEELAGFCSVPLDVIRDAEREFRGYWIIGKGAGRKHSRGAWIAKCRERIRLQFERGELGNQADKPGQTVVISP